MLSDLPVCWPSRVMTQSRHRRLSSTAMYELNSRFQEKMGKNSDENDHAYVVIVQEGLETQGFIARHDFQLLIGK